MKIAVYHYPTIYKQNFSWRWIEALRKRNVDLYLFDAQSIDMDLCRLRNSSLIIRRKVSRDLGGVLDQPGARVGDGLQAACQQKEQQKAGEQGCG